MLHFGLAAAKAFEDLGEKDQASRISCRATRSDRAEISFDRRPPLPGLIALPHIFTHELLAAQGIGRPVGRASFYRRHAAVRHHARGTDPGKPSLGIRPGKGPSYPPQSGG